MVIRKFAPGLSHHGNVRVVQTPTRTYAVEEDADFNARPGALAKGVTKLPPDFIGIKDVSGEIYRLVSGMNRIQHCGKIFVSVGEEFDLVAGERDWIGQRQSRAEKFRIANGERMVETILESVTPDKKEAEDQNDREEAESKHDPFGQRELPPALVEPM
jgi:hypothetical protein